MRQVLTIIIIMLTTVSTFGQVEKTLNKILSQKDLAKFKLYIKNYYLEKNNIQISQGLTRDIAYGFQEAVFYIRISEAWHKGMPISCEERINVITNGNRLIYFYFESKKISGYPKTFDQTIDTIYQFADSARLHSLNLIFAKTYNTQLNSQELFIDSIYLGKTCGHLGTSTPPQQLQITNWVKSCDTTSLHKWLQSTNTEKQVYAVQGFYSLQSKGVKLDNSILKLISNIISKKGTVNTCGNCSSDYRKISEVVKDFAP